PAGGWRPLSGLHLRRGPGPGRGRRVHVGAEEDHLADEARRVRQPLLPVRPYVVSVRPCHRRQCPLRLEGVVPSYLAAGAIGMSRISTNKHHLSDVIAGATIGYVTGRTVVRVNGDPVGRKRTFTLHPMTDAAGGGVGMGG